MKKIVVYSLLTLFIVSCDDKPAKTSQTEVENTVALEENTVVDEKTETDSEVIFSTENLENAEWHSHDEYPLKIIGHDGEIYDNVDDVIKLPDYNNFEIVIWSTEGGDDIPYTLCVVKEKIIDTDSGLNIAPHWSEPGNDENNYSKKTFKIYKDYTIEINTEEKEEGNEVQKYTKYYKINNEGSFYELKTIKIGSQIWMAENLNVKAKNSKCYYNKPANCEKYGGLYEWEIAKTICPKGWHLPADKEWQKLIASAGGEKQAGKQLKEKNGWAALFGGYFFVSDSEEMPSSFMGLDVNGCWWSASAGNEYEDYSTGNRWFIGADGKIEDLPDEYGNSCSVRCVKD